MEGYFQIMGKKYKPTNKERDSAISHLFQRLANLDALLNAHIEEFEQYTAHRKTDKKFAKYMEKKMEKQIEEHRAKEQDGKTLEGNTEDKGQRAVGVRTPL